MAKLFELRASDARVRVAAMAGLTLLVELALIRWLARNVFHLGFFANFILLACFLGIGLGFLCARRAWDLP